MTGTRETTRLQVGVEVRQNPPGYPNHSMTGRIITAIPGGFEVKWSNNSITNENQSTIEAH